MNQNDFHTDYADEFVAPLKSKPLSKFQMWEIERSRLIHERNQAQNNFETILKTLAQVLTKVGTQTLDTYDLVNTPTEPVIKTTEHPDGTITVKCL